MIVEKPGGSQRICLDPRDLNKATKREHLQLATFDEIASRLTGATRFAKLDKNKGYWQIDEQSSKLTTMADIASYAWSMVYILRKKYFIRGSVRNLKQWMVLKLV